MAAACGEFCSRAISSRNEETSSFGQGHRDRRDGQRMPPPLAQDSIRSIACLTPGLLSTSAPLINLRQILAKHQRAKGPLRIGRVRPTPCLTLGLVGIFTIRPLGCNFRLFFHQILKPGPLSQRRLGRSNGDSRPFVWRYSRQAEIPPFPFRRHYLRPMPRTH